MRPDTDLLGAFGCPDGELVLPPVDFSHLCLPPLTRRQTGVATRWRTLTAGADSAFAGIEISPDRIEGGVSMTMIITGVANTGGRIASLNRFARCSGWTRRLKEPLATGVSASWFAFKRPRR